MSLVSLGPKYKCSQITHNKDARKKLHPADPADEAHLKMLLRRPPPLKLSDDEQARRLRDMLNSRFQPPTHT